ncbi:hypothetical protein BH18ACT17_BH18ACT17_01050 [soil metagenome]
MTTVAVAVAEFDGQLSALTDFNRISFGLCLFSRTFFGYPHLLTDGRRNTLLP